MKATDRIGTTAAMILSLTVSGGWVPTSADDSAAPGTAIQALQDSHSRLPQPSPELQSLTRAIAGSWSTEYLYASTDSTSKANVGYGEEIWRSGPGGFTLLEEEHVRTATGEQFILALHWWDESASRLRGMLCSNSGPSACDVDSYANSSLTWDGKQLVIDLDFLQNGKKMRWHEVFGHFTVTSFMQTGDMGEVGSELKRVVTIHATRVTDAR